MDFEFLSPSDKPALVAATTPHFAEMAVTAFTGLGYKVHTAVNHGDFIDRFTRIPYQVVLLEELFDANVVPENLTLLNLQVMPMNQRRHATVILLGETFHTLDAMQAFGASVHAVVSEGDIDKLPQIIQKVTAENDLFLSVYRDTALRMVHDKG
jgi:hypothetical protein